MLRREALLKRRVKAEGITIYLFVVVPRVEYSV